jgi:hypothetical protein
MPGTEPARKAPFDQIQGRLGVKVNSHRKTLLSSNEPVMMEINRWMNE